MLFGPIGKHAVLAFVLVLWSASAASPQPGGLDEIARRYPTPERLAAFLKERIVFKEDQQLFGTEDYWQQPEEFLNRGAGDCEDYALLAQEILKRQGKEAFVLSLYGDENYAHTVCVFVEQGCSHVINQDRVIRYGARSIEELATDLYPRWKWAAIARRVCTRGQAIRKITARR